VVGVTDSAGGLLSEQRYLPFGEPRFAPGIAETDYGFTGQRDLAAIGLMDYNARFYDAGIGRFASADSIVPGVFSPQSLNRYSYVNNRPTVFIDPSGHALCSDLGGSCTASYVQPTSAPNPLTSPAKKPRVPYCQLRPEKCNTGGFQDINKGIAADLADTDDQPVISVDDVTTGYVGPLPDEIQRALIARGADPALVSGVIIKIAPNSAGCLFQKLIGQGAAALTFGNTITYCGLQYFTAGTHNGINQYLVHELVHVRQYRDNGFDPFWESVVDVVKIVSGSDYNRYELNPYEIEAQACQVAFVDDPTIPLDSARCLIR
jgi:RHS repeat-associated protein